MTEALSGETNFPIQIMDCLEDKDFYQPEKSENLKNSKNILIEDQSNKIRNISNNNSKNNNIALKYNKKNHQNNKNSKQNAYKTLGSSDLSYANIKPKSSIFDDSQEISYEPAQMGAIILKKLNQQNQDIDFEYQEPSSIEAFDEYIINNNNKNDVDNFSSNSYSNYNNTQQNDYSPRLSEETEREFFEKIVIKTKTPFEEYSSKIFKLKRCENITTIKIDQEKKFSYITKPKNNQKDLYFINFNTNLYLFELEDFLHYNRHTINLTRIPYPFLKKFITDLNKPIETLKNSIQKYRIWYNCKFLLVCLLVSVLFSLGVYFLNITAKDYFTMEQNTMNNLLLSLSFIFFLVMTTWIYLFCKSKKIEYYINKILLEKQDAIDEILYKWNAEYFIAKKDYLATIPKTFKYVMLIMKPNKKLLLEDHELD